MVIRSQLLLFLLLSILFSVSKENVIAQSDLKGEKLSGFGSIVEVMYDYGDKMKMPEPGAKVIWGVPWRKMYPTDFIEIVEHIKPSCSEEIILYVAADDYF